MLLDSDGVPMDWDTKEVYAELCWIGNIYPTVGAALNDAATALCEGVEALSRELYDAKTNLAAQVRRLSEFENWVNRGARLFTPNAKVEP